LHPLPRRIWYGPARGDRRREVGSRAREKKEEELTAEVLDKFSE
jgi:hypothetical protein